MTQTLKRPLSFLGPGLIPVILLISLAEAPAQPSADSSVVELLNRAYAELGTNRAEARRLFLRVTELEPSHVTAWRELGYLDLETDNLEAALGEFRQSERLRSSDTIRLQIAYVLASLRRETEAKELLTALVQSPDPAVRRKASEQLAQLESSQRGMRNWWRIYADPYYDTRWNSTFLHFDFQDGYDLTDDRKISFYGILSLSTDSRSSSETVPEILSDNSLLLGLGFRVKPFYGASAIVQEGVAAELIGGGGSTTFRNDFRAVAFYGNGVYPGFKVHDGFRMPFYPIVDFYSSFGYYSRYENAIGYAQLKAGARVGEVSQTALDLYALGDVAWDVELDYYNNILEGGFGARLIPWVDLDLHFVAEWRRGKYLDVSDAAMLQRSSRYDQYYTGWRFMLVFERTF